MKTIYKITDNHTGHSLYCLKNELGNTVNGIEGQLRISKNELCSDNIGIEMFFSESELIDYLNKP